MSPLPDGLDRERLGEGQIKTASYFSNGPRLFAVLLLTWLVDSGAVDAQAPGSNAPHDKVSQYAQLNAQTSKQLTQFLKRFHLPSISLAIRVKEEVVFAEAQGLACIADNRSATTNTPYAVGSLAKPLTTSAVMRLVQDGKLSLDDSVHKHITDYPRENGGFNLRQLASHTAGIRHGTLGRLKKEWLTPKKHFHPHEALDFFKDEKLLFVPGSKFTYSSSGYVLLSDVIAKASGQPYTKAMQELVFEPLKMRNTEHDIEGAANGNEAVYYSSFANDKFVPALTRRDRSFLFGGGGYLSTPVDLVNMAQDMRNTDYLSAELQEQIFTPVKLDNGDDNPQQYALGWRVQTRQDPKVNGRPVLGVHHGGTVSKAASAFLLTYPEYQASIAFATNTIPNSNDSNDDLRGEMWVLLAKYVARIQ
jgi:CubicO group peptidase (beta-lactamase class C family)